MKASYRGQAPLRSKTRRFLRQDDRACITRTTKLYHRTGNEITLDDFKRIAIRENIISPSVEAMFVH
jgi:hypothetical protein